MTSMTAGLDPALNTIPSRVGHIHLMGICGTGVGALAGMLRQVGYTVTGSDANVYPPMSDFLAGQGIEVRIGYGADNLSPRPDLVIVGNVIRRDNPEAQALASMAIPYLSMPQALGHFFIAGKKAIVVTGTHGKTTTSSLLATMLKGAGLDPGGMIGGIVQAFGANYAIGRGAHFVVEGDEYDTAFFDKGPKFLHYQPRIAIITSIEFDHADIYADLEAVKRSFARLVAIMPPEGLLIACHDDPVVRELTGNAPCRVQGYGLQPDNHWQLADLDAGSAGTSFTVLCDDRQDVGSVAGARDGAGATDRQDVGSVAGAREGAGATGRFFGRFHSPMAGRHNALNALAVIAVLHELGLSREVMARELRDFQGVRRRQEVRGEVDGITVIDDFAHHPTAVRETLGALSDAYQGRRLIAVFEPRTNSSRRRVFQKDYPQVFDNADLIVVREPDPLTNLAPEERFSAAELVRDLRARGRDAHVFSTTDAILDYLAQHARQGDVIAILSNGGFDSIHTRLLALLLERKV